MPSDTTYNGWTNYETWAVKLWLDNDEGSQGYWSERTREVFVSSSPRFCFQTQTDKARIDLADELKREHEENAPEVVGIFADLLQASLDSVDWHEIASSLLDSMAEDATANQDEERVIVGSCGLRT